jgi:ATP-dependent DNA helicase HFM1/MER3
VDCRIYDKDSITTRNALDIARCLSAKCWENSPAQIRQLEGIGPAAVRKLVMAGVRSIQELRKLDSFRIEAIFSRNPPFGVKILNDIASIPILRVYGDVISTTADKERINPVKALFRVEIGCLNDVVPQKFRGRVLFAIFIAETDGYLVEFRRIAVAKLEGGKDMRFTVELTRPGQVVTCSLACEDVGQSFVL